MKIYLSLFYEMILNKQTSQTDSQFRWAGNDKLQI